MIGGILTLASLAGQAYGLAQSAKLNKQRQQAINNRRTMADAFFNKEYYANPTDRIANKSVMQSITDRIKNQQKINASKAAITGASDEVGLAQGEAQAQAYDETLKGLAQNETAIKQNALNTKIAQDNVLDAQQEQLNQEKAQSNANLINNAVNLGSSALGTNFAPVEESIKNIFKKKP